jgi:hypothetical protein
MNNKNPGRNLVVGLVVAICISMAVEADAFFGAKFEPPDGMIYHCAQAEVRPRDLNTYDIDWTGISQYAETCGHQPKLIMHYISLDERALRLLKPTIRKIPRKKLSKERYDYLPQIGLDFYRYGNPSNLLRPIDITQDIAEGRYDKQIRSLANMFKRMKIPCFLRPGYEFGGNGQGRFASKAYWIQAWRRIYDIFQEKKAYNVAFVWNTLDAQDFMDYYPGDTYVDWWAINVFVNNADQDSFINSFIQQAAVHQKPVMIAESTPRYIGSIGGETAWNTWYQPYFSLITRYPHVKSFCYINASWEGYFDPSFAYDCRIQSNTFVATKYCEAMSGPGIIHAIKK